MGLSCCVLICDGFSLLYTSVFFLCVKYCWLSVVNCTGLLLCCLLSRQVCCSDSLAALSALSGALGPIAAAPCA